MTAGNPQERALDELRGRWPGRGEDEIVQTFTYSFLCLRLSLADLLGHLAAGFGWWRRG